MQKGQTLIFLLVGIIILAVVAGGAYLLGTKNKTLSETVSEQNPVIWPSATTEPSSKPSIESLPTNSDEAANWKTYTNSKYNFFLQYPIQSVMDSLGCYDNSKGECVLVIGQCGAYISEKINDPNEKIISVDGLAYIRVVKWNSSIKDYMKNATGPNGPSYKTEPIIGSNADEAIRQGERIDTGTVDWAPYLDYNYAYLKKDNNLFIFAHTQNSGRGCLVPGNEASDFLERSNLNQQEYNDIRSKYSAYSPENYFKFIP